MKELTSLEFAKHFKNIIQKTGEERFCFVLGSGASIQSGIPTGGQLANKWLREMMQDFWSDEHNEWLKANSINVERAGDFYSEIFKKRFDIHAQEGYDELNRLMEKITPSFGYSVLSQLLETKNNVVITTNFDSLIEEALFSFSIKRPLVCGHEYLAPFAKISDTRPLIIKIHRDRQLNPFNSPEQLEKIKDEWVAVLNSIFAQCIPVFIGYGGNDGSLMGYLESIRNFSNLFWCDLSKDLLKQEVKELIEKHDGKFVKIDGFDELMFDLFSVLGYLPVGDALIESATKRAGDYANAIKKIQEAKSKSLITEDKTNAEELTRKIKDSGGWLAYYYKAEAEPDILKRRDILEEGLSLFPKVSGMVNTYAEFLANHTAEYAMAERFYQMALELDPYDDVNHYSYAIFLNEQKKDFESAEIFYRSAIELGPNEPDNHESYAVFLHYDKRDFVQAEKHYNKALELSPNSDQILCNFAIFLEVVKKDYAQAERFYKIALKIEPDDSDNNANYASFLWNVRENFSEAEKYFLRGEELDPENVNCCANYAGMLFAAGETARAMKKLDAAFKHCKNDEELELELYFYRYAHVPAQRDAAILTIKELIGKGHRSLDWSFDHNIRRARQDGHPDPQILQLIAEIITENIPIPPDF